MVAVSGAFHLRPEDKAIKETRHRDHGCEELEHRRGHKRRGRKTIRLKKSSLSEQPGKLQKSKDCL
jgi:hypothetical protein